MPSRRVVEGRDRVGAVFAQVVKELINVAHECHEATGNEEACSETQAAIIFAMSSLLEEIRHWSKEKDPLLTMDQFKAEMRAGTKQARERILGWKEPTDKQVEEISQKLLERLK